MSIISRENTETVEKADFIKDTVKSVTDTIKISIERIPRGIAAGQVNLENADIKDFEDFTGFTPIIFQMAPVINIPLLSGLDQSEKQDAVSFDLSRK